MKVHRFGFVGAGNMARALIGGVSRSGLAHVSAFDPDSAKLSLLEQEFGISPAPSNAALAAASDTIVICVKPQVMAPVVQEMAPALRATDKLVISVAAGVSNDDFAHWLGPTALIRAMPNTPALIGVGVTALWANESASGRQREIARELGECLGKVVWLEREEQLHAVTAVSGSGPAYIYLVLEALVESAESLGMDRELAETLVLATARGSIELQQSTGSTPAGLRQQVTSPGGTTAAAVDSLERSDLRAIFRRALAKAADRSLELGSEFGADRDT